MPDEPVAAEPAPEPSAALPDVAPVMPAFAPDLTAIDYAAKREGDPVGGEVREQQGSPPSDNR